MLTKLIPLSLLFLLFALPVSAEMEDKYHFDNPQQRTLYQVLTKELRCPKCQNQNIADSDAMIAVDLKRKVHELVLEGYTEQQVIDYMKQRYGEFVYYQPPVNPMTIWLWLLPVLFILLAISLLIFSRKKQVVVDDEKKLEQAKAILERDE